MTLNIAAMNELEEDETEKSHIQVYKQGKFTEPWIHFFQLIDRIFFIICLIIVISFLIALWFNTVLLFELHYILPSGLFYL